MSRKIEDLALEVRKMAEEFLFECNAKDITVFITNGLRTWDEQTALYAQGREPLMEVNKLRVKAGMGIIYEPQNTKVTNAMGGFSPHNFGRAIDVAFHWDVNGDGKVQPGEVGWDGDWWKVGQIGESIGFEWGGRWVKQFPPDGDKPHFQFMGGFTLAELREAYVREKADA